MKLQNTHKAGRIEIQSFEDWIAKNDPKRFSVNGNWLTSDHRAGRDDHEIESNKVK